MTRRNIVIGLCCVLLVALIVEGARELDAQNTELKRVKAELATAQSKLSADRVVLSSCVDLLHKNTRFLEDLTGGTVPPGAVVACAVLPEPQFPDSLLSRVPEKDDTQ